MASQQPLPPGVPAALYNALPKSTHYFDGQGQSGNWSDLTNWWQNNTASASSIVVVPVSATLNGTFTGGNVMLLGSETVTVNGTLNAESTGPCQGFMVCDYATATFTAGSALNCPGLFVVGNDSDGTLTAQTGAILASTNAVIGKLDDGVGTLTVAGGHWTNSSLLVVGLEGKGALTVDNGGLISVGTRLQIGTREGASGTVSVSGGGTLAVGQVLQIGSPAGTPQGSGEGALTVGAAGLVTIGGELDIYGGNALTLSGGTVQTGASAAGVHIIAGGEISGYGSVNAATSQIDNNGTIRVTGGTLALHGAVSGTGVLDIASGGTLLLDSSRISEHAVTFGGAGAELELSHGLIDFAPITGFASGDTIAMAGANAMAWNANSDILSFSSNGTNIENLHLSGSYTAADFTFTQSHGFGIVGLTPGH